MYLGPQLYPAEQAGKLMRAVKCLEFVDGRRTAGGIELRRKNKCQAAAGKLLSAIRRGERACIVGWIESFIHDPGARNLLYRLDRHLEALAKVLPDQTDVREEAVALYQGLLRALAR